MNRKSLLIIGLLAATAAAQPDPTLEKARRAFENSEWASAAALYGLVCDRTPGNTEAYARRIVASEIIADTAATVAVIEEALNDETEVAALFHSIRTNALAAGKPHAFTAVLDRTRKKLPWLARPCDAALLEYYKFRNNPAATEAYAKKLLAGLPDDIGYLSTLAGSYIMQGKDSEALGVYRRILDIDPAHFDTLVALGSYWLEAGDRERARKYLTRAAEIRPTPALKQTLQELKQTP